MRVLFIGTTQMSAAFLQALIAARAEIVGVICKPSSTFNSDFADLKPICRDAKIPFWYTRQTDSAAKQWARERTPDVIFCCGWSHILDAEWLALAPRGVIGYHPSLLPQGRGRHPIVWTLALGRGATGSSFFQMDAGVDTGPLLSRVSIVIPESMDAGGLYRLLKETGCRQIVEVWNHLRIGGIVPLPQSVMDDGFAWRKRIPADGRIDWRMPAVGIVNLVRALARPYPGADLVFSMTAYKVWKARDGGNAPGYFEPGRVLAVSGSGIRVKAGIGSVLLATVKPEIVTKEGEYL